MADQIQMRYKYARRLHWRQGILLAEIVILFVVGFIPHSLNMTATIFCVLCLCDAGADIPEDGCYSYASTMCIGNLRSGTAAFSHYLQDKKTEQLKQAAYYFGIIFLFAIGAGLGGNLTEHFGIHMIWISCILLGLSFYNV